MEEFPRDLIDAVRARPDRTALLLDFDGTLSGVVEDPEAAVPVPGAVAVLRSLAASYRTVAVISGRPVSFLAEHLPTEVHLSGLYGLETVAPGVGASVDHPDAARWRIPVAEATALIASATAPGESLHGARVEPKGLSITVHTRTRPDLAEGVDALAREVAGHTGLLVRPAKMSVELHPPVAADKGTAVRSLLEGCEAALFVGDDVGDLPAFDALRADRAEHRLARAVLVGVGGPELPAEVADRVDALVPDQPSVVALLQQLVV